MAMIRVAYYFYTVCAPAAGVTFPVRSQILISILGLGVCSLSVFCPIFLWLWPWHLLTTHSWRPALVYFIHSILLPAKWILKMLATLLFCYEFIVLRLTIVSFYSDVFTKFPYRSLTIQKFLTHCLQIQNRDFYSQDFQSCSHLHIIRGFYFPIHFV